MIFRLARADEADKILALYDSVRGKGFCVWDETYPTMLEVNGDLNTDNLYVFADGEEIAAALSVMPVNEMDAFDCWQVSDGTQKEIARIVVSEKYRGHGLAGKMVENITEILKDKGFRAIHISAAAANAPALKTYKKLGFEIVAEKFMYGHDYCLLEKII